MPLASGISACSGVEVCHESAGADPCRSAYRPGQVGTCGDLQGSGKSHDETLRISWRVVMSALIHHGGRVLGDRDIEVLRLLARFRLLKGGQLQRLIVSDGSPITRARRTRAVLGRLCKWRLIQRLERRIGGIKAGSDGYVYGLTGRGVGMLARTDGTPRRRAVEAPGERFVQHVLAVGELYVRLVEAARTDNTIELVTFDAEPWCWRRYPSHGGMASIRPDAFTHTRDGVCGYVHFCEIDRATESLTTIRAKCAAYIGFWRSGVEQRRLGAFPRVLWIVPDAARAIRISGIIQQLGRDIQPLFAVAQFDAAVTQIFGRAPTTNFASKGGAL